jgi:NADH-quinone oxidoreductase subunit A
VSEFVLLILLFIAAAALAAVGMLVVGWLIGPRRSGAVKEMPYESGMDPIHDARRRFDVRFHLVAIAFLVFDVELLFLYPWAVAARAPSPVPAAAVVADDTADISVDDAIPARQFADQPVDRRIVFGGVMFFVALVVLGLVYEWKKGILQWR